MSINLNLHNTTGRVRREVSPNILYCIHHPNLIMLLRVILLVALMAHVAPSEGASVPGGCPRSPVAWRVDWKTKVPEISLTSIYPSPGEVITGVTVSSIVELIGRMWNAQSYLEIDGLFCVEFGPLANQFDPSGSMREQCDGALAALDGGKKYDIEAMCNKELSAAFSLDDMTNQYITECSAGSEYDFDFNGTIMDMGLMEPDLVCTLANTLYSHDIVERVSVIVLRVLKWLGPSPFSGDVFGACSALRQFFNMANADIFSEVKGILAYPVADGIEFLREASACDSQVDAYVIAVDIISIVSGMDRSALCSFLSSDHTRQEYLDMASTVINRVVSIPTDQARCDTVMDTVSQSRYMDAGTVYGITGYNLTIQEGRRAFCSYITTAFSQRSTFIPSPYVLPETFSVDTWMPFANNIAEICPDFYFNDAIDVLGAFLQSATLVDGASVLCTRFEAALTQVFGGEVAAYAADACSAVANRDTAELEKVCLEVTVPLQYGGPRLTTVRDPTVVYMAVIGADFGRKLLSNLTSISQSSVCKAAGDFYYSKNNLQTVIRLALNVYMTEFLPIANNLCKDYANFVRFVKQGGAFPDKAVEDVNRMVLALMGFADRQGLCSKISTGIDALTGATDAAIVSELESESLLFFTDAERCETVVDTALTLAEEYEIRVTPDEFHVYTGYRSRKALCAHLTASFTDCNGARMVTTGYFFVICVAFWNVLNLYLLGP